MNGGAVALGHPIGASGGRILDDARPRAAPRGRRARAGRDLLGRRAGRRAADRGLTRRSRAAGGVVLRDGARAARPPARATTTGRSRRASSTPGESWEEAARREVEEETGPRCELGEEVGRTALRRRAAAARRRCGTTGWRPTASPVAQNEVDEVRWVPLDEAPGAAQLRARPRPRRAGDEPDGGLVAFEHVLVVGAGQMGGGIAQVVAASGRRVSLHDPFPGATDRALETMRAQPREARGEGRPRPGRGARAHRRSSTSSCRPT